MQVVKTIFVSLMLFVPFLKTYASNLKDSASFGLNTYSDNADVQVYSPTFAFMKTLSKNLLVGVKVRIDAIAAASIRNGASPVRVDAVASASSSEGAFDEIRYAPTFVVAYEDANNAASGGIYYSKEKDYEGKALFLNYTRELNEQNTAIGIGISQSADKWSPVFDRALPRDYRNEGKVDLSINQLLSPTSSIGFVYSFVHSEGFLSSPYHYVLQDDFAKFENYPETRTGHAFALKGVTLLNGANSLNYSYRYYMDDWGITSNTLSTEWLKDFSSTITSGLRLRYYSQGEAFFAKDIGSYRVDNQYFAIDYRMSSFNSVDVGIPLIYKPSNSSPYKVTASIDYYQTSDNDYIKNRYEEDNLKAFFTSFSIDYEF